MADERPQYQYGTGTIGGSKFHWGSGTPGKYWSIPYGDYPVTPDAPTGDWAHRVGAIPIANNVIPDPQLGRNRIGIMIHSGSSDSLDQLYTQGCFKVAPQEWPAVRSEILKEAANGPLYLHVQPGGVAAFTNTKTFSQASSDTPAANANTAANTTANAAPPAQGVTVNSYPQSRADATAAQRDAFNRAYATSIGVNPDLVSGISRAEGLNAPGAGPSQVDVSGGQPFSFGDFQLNVHPGAMGAQALKAGVDPRDPNQWQAANKFAIDQMKAGGVGPWKGDPVAAAYLKNGAVPEATGPIDPSIVAHGGTSPAIPTTPGTTINSTPATAGIGGQLGQLSKDPNVKKMLGLPDDDAQGQQAEVKPSPMIGPAPQARNVSPLLGAPQAYEQRMAALNQPLAWGSAPPGQMPGTGYGVQAQPSVYGTSLMSNLGRSLDPMWMNSWGA